MRNPELARQFERLADLLAIKGENQFKIRAYRRAANVIEGLPREAADLLEAGEDLRQFDGIGDAIAEKIGDLVTTGRTKAIDDAEAAVPPDLLRLLTIQDLGPKRVGELHRELGVDGPEALQEALEKGRLEDLPGFGEKLVSRLNTGIEQLARQDNGKRRVLLHEAEAAAEEIITYLRQVSGNDNTDKIEAAGSLRRRKETVGDLDILAVAEHSDELMQHFTDFPEAGDVLMKGDTRSSIVLASGLQVDLRVVPEESFGAALQYFTGSKNHNVRLRGVAQKRGLKVNEYGVYRENELIAGTTEEDVYGSLGLPWIPPELREDSGEFAARDTELDALVTVDEIKGDLHCHTTASDGSADIEEMAEEATRRGRRYLAISDHSGRLTVAGGLSEERLKRQLDAIDEANQKREGITLLKSLEVDILEDGSLDLSEELLKQLDLVIVSVHSKFSLSKERQTDRVCTALRHPEVIILAHPTGRRLGTRKGYDIDLDSVFRTAVEHGCFLEINSQPERLDLGPTDIRRAKELGARFVVSTDAHAPKQLSYMRFGVDQARRGWLRTEDVANTRDLPDLRKLLRKAAQ